MLLVTENQHKVSHTPSVRSPAVVKERIRLGSVLCVSFSVLTVLAGIQSPSKTSATYAKDSLSEQVDEENRLRFT